MNMKWSEMVGIFLVAGVISIIGNMIGYNAPLYESVVGYGILLVITLLGIFAARIIPLKLPMVFWISIIALLSTSGISPFAKFIIDITNKIDFLALCTPILAYAGLAVGKDLGMFQQMSWRIVLVALAVYTGTFVFATAVAQIMLHFEGVI